MVSFAYFYLATFFLLFGSVFLLQVLLLVQHFAFTDVKTWTIVCLFQCLHILLNCCVKKCECVAHGNKRLVCLSSEIFNFKE